MKRGRLLDIAAGIAGSFVSRNNDVDGYWGLGLLRRHADEHALTTLRFDLLAGHAEFDAPALFDVARRYHAVLLRQLSARRLPRDLVAEAQILVTFDRDAPHAPAARTRGAPFSCTVRLVDGSGRSAERRLVGHCAPHDPKRESRRATRPPAR